MAPERALPARGNPLMQPDRTPLHEILEERRCHAQTKLVVAPGQVNTSNATKAENLIEKFDYVHLRAPLPEDLTGSGVFVPQGSMPVPESYFLMRRSSDGFVSATGLFKAAFPWASRHEEHLEREYLKTLAGTDPQEIAGNVWVRPEIALDLAAEYNIIAWVEALLSNESVQLYSVAGGPKKVHGDPKPITSPPHFTMPPKSSSTAGTTSRKPRRTEKRSTSPAETPANTAPTPSRPKKTPRKPRATRKPAAAAPVEEATPSIADSAVDSGEELDVDGEESNDVNAGREESEEPEVASNAQDELDDLDDADTTQLPKDSVRVSLEEEIKDDGHTQTTHTTVKVELPASSPDLELPHDTDGVVEKAREIVANVREMNRSKIEADNAAAAAARSSPSSSKKSLKRGRDEFEEDLMDIIDGPEELVEELVEQFIAERPDGVETRPMKRVRLMVPAEDYRREKVMKRALIGLSASFAFGLLIPAITVYWGV